MRLIDKVIAVSLVLTAMICLLNTKAPAGFAGNLTMFLFSAVLFFFIGGYPKRIRLAKQRKMLSGLPVHTVLAEKISCQSVDTGKTDSRYVVDGYSQEIGGDWRSYEHGHFESRNVYDGNQAVYRSAENPEETLVLRSLPKDFFLRETLIPMTLGTFRVNYVSHGKTNYWLSETETESK